MSQPTARVAQEVHVPDPSPTPEPALDAALDPALDPVADPPADEQPTNRAARRARARGKGAKPVLPPDRQPPRAGGSGPVASKSNYTTRRSG